MQVLFVLDPVNIIMFASFTDTIKMKMIRGNGYEKKTRRKLCDVG